MSFNFTVVMSSTALLAAGVASMPGEPGPPPPPPPAATPGDPYETTRWVVDSSDIVSQTLNEASRLESLGDLDGALAVLADGLKETNAPELRDFRAELAEARLLRLAGVADSQGRFREARDLYIQALGVRGTRSGIADRIRDLDPLAELEQRTADAEAERRRMVESIDSSERRVADALQRLNDCEIAAERIARDHRRCDQSQRYADQAIRDLERRVRDLQCTNDRLCRDLENARCEIDRWRRKYERARYGH